jgi:hypothetical protein
MIIKKIHRVLTFEQRPWLRDYIDKNTKLRKEAKSEFEKDFYKLMNNAVFGKTMENLRKRVDIKLCTNEKQARKLIAKPNYARRTIFTESLVAMHFTKKKIVYDRPIYLGFCILELSKLHMYKFHYDCIKTKYGDKAKLLFTDTDSLVYEIQTDDVYDDIRKDVELGENSVFDTSNYEGRNGIQSVNGKVLGKMKDECGGKIMSEFVGLKAKMYNCQIQGEKDKKAAKGIKKCVDLQFIEYKECLFKKIHVHKAMNVIRNRGHKLYTEEVNKLALSPYDDKRYILDNGTDTLGYGHYKIGLVSQ